MLVLIHGLLAVALLGALTHQGVNAVWVGARKRSFVERFAAVASPYYVNAIIIVFVITFLFGAYIYTNYRTEVRPPLEELRIFWPIGLFDLKEHFLTLSLALLPTYWILWKKIPLTEHRAERRATTVTIAVLVWYGFVVGHILNNFRGLGT
jgi:hypothetical protein